MWVLVRNLNDFKNIYEEYLENLVRDQLGFNNFWNKYTLSEIENCPTYN